MNHHVNKKYWAPYTTMMRFMFYDEVSVISDSEGDDINGIGEDEGEPVCLDLPSEVWAKVLDCEYKMIHSIHINSHPFKSLILL